MSANSTPTSPRSQRAEQAGTVLLYGIFGLLLFGPLAFGATEPWSIFLMEAGSAALFLLWIGKQVLQDGMKITWNPIFLPMGVFGLLIISQLIFGSAYWHDTESRALLYFAYGLLCFLAGQTLLRGSQARRLAVLFSVYGAAVAGFALIYGISPNDRLYWWRLPRNGGWIYGPYVNHNHYAGLMEMLVPIPSGVGADPTGFSQGPHSGCRGCRPDGGHNLPFRIARRHAGDCRGTCHFSGLAG